MIIDIVAQFNFLDFIILILMFRICYIAAKMGLSVEIFKFSGVIFSTYISLHYYTVISDFIQQKFMPKAMPLEFMDFIVFLLLIIIGYLCSVGLRALLYRFVQLNALPRINQTVGLFLGFARGFLIIGLLAYALAISSVNYFSNSVKRSYFGIRAVKIAPATYDWIWNSIFSKFSVQEKFNSTVTEAMDKLNRK